MTSDQDKIIHSLKLAFDKLKEKCENLAAENAELKDDNAKSFSIIEEQQALILEQKDHVATLKVASAIGGSAKTGSQEAKLLINKIVREIDKCIALSNK